jgi:3-deoxy-D-manno-octulosonic-acid transferase
MIFIYNLLFSIALILSSPYFLLKAFLTGKYRRSLAAKLGLANLEYLQNTPGAPRILVHAVSVGEVTVATPIIANLRNAHPRAAIFLSTTTETGGEMAEKIAASADGILYAPLDIPCAVLRMLNAIRPDILVLVETELWPNLINICRRRAIKIVLVNGRVSPRSYKKYLLSRCFWRGLLESIEKAGVISNSDGERLIKMGMPAERVFTIGNAKNDALATRTSPFLKEEIARKLGFGDGSRRDGLRIFVAGSTHEGEEVVILKTFQHLIAKDARFKLILAPRHPQRASVVQKYAEQAGFTDVVLFSALSEGQPDTDNRIIIVDVIGELFKIYALADVVFCGGSLVPKGGQNILEAAAWGNVVLYGRHMDDFLREKTALEEAGVGICVADGRELTRRVLDLLNNPNDLASRREKAREVVIAGMGAARRYAELIGASLANLSERR